MKEIPLNGKVGAGKAVLVDDEDFEWLSQYSFTLVDARRKTLRPHNYHYVKTRHTNSLEKRTDISIQQLILGKAPPGHKIDHIDRDTLNNQRSNLRIVSDSVSAHNQNVKGRSKFRGVSWHKRNNRWRSEIKAINGRRYHFGCFTDEIEAAQNYDYYALLIYGSEATVNFPDHDYSTFTPKRIIKELIDAKLPQELVSATC